MTTTHAARTVSALRAFLSSEAAGGMMLIAAAAVAMAIANSPAADAWFHLLHAEVGPGNIPGIAHPTVHFWVNDGLMAIFFLLVGLEVKRELTDGRLANPAQRRLPFIAAAAGMAVPALVYLGLAGSDPALWRGWAIPAATDIAFAMAVLAMLGNRAPTTLKLLLVTIAIVDDIGAVAIIALFYSTGINMAALGAVAVIWLAMMALNRLGVRALAPYLLGFVLLWIAMLLSGVHATLAGVAAAFAIPVIPTPGTPDAADSPLHRLEHGLAAPVAFIVLPLFGLANAGVPLAQMSWEALSAPLPVAIVLGLFIGKQVGIFGAIRLTVALGIAPAPRGATWMQIYGVSLLCGIGFTMSLFISDLAFRSGPQADQAHAGIVIGTLLSALAGYIVLRLAPLHPDHAAEEQRLEEEIEADGDAG